MTLIAFIGVLILTIFSAHPRRLAADSNSLCFFDMIYPLHSCVNLALKGHADTSFHNTKTFIQVSQIHSLASYYATSAGAAGGNRTHMVLLPRDFLTTLCYHSRVTALQSGLSLHHAFLFRCAPSSLYTFLYEASLGIVPVGVPPNLTRFTQEFPT